MARVLIAPTVVTLLGAGLALGQSLTTWRSGSGMWNDAGRWTAGLPNAYGSADVRGTSLISVPSGKWAAGDLRIERANDAILRIRGGSFLGRTLSVGFGFGSQAMVAIEGSRASAVHVLDYVYFQAAADPGGRPGVTTLAFAIDEHGVTPITIQSRVDGLRILPVAPSQCRLQISLRAIPPREDITLVSSRMPTIGSFAGLPEGTEIAATYAGKTYRLALTYRGGPNGTDLVLRNRSSYDEDAPATHVRPVPAPPAALWREHPIYPLSIPVGRPAFPGAEGYGAFSKGGNGGRKVFVDNLNDSGPGSLRAAVDTEGPRMVVFRVSGSIALKTPLRVRYPFLTIDGQRAPGDGLVLREHGIVVATHDVVLRYFRIRLGDEGVSGSVNYTAGEGDDGIRFEAGAKNCIADHLSLSWTTGKIITLNTMSDRVTIQWCILSESLNFAGHGYASLAGGHRVSLHHNLLAHNFSRNVRFRGGVDADFRNNTIYDWGDAAGYGEFDRLNYVANYLKPGPSTTQRPKLFHLGDRVVMPGSLYVEGNLLEGEAKVNEDNWRGMGAYDLDRDSLRAAEPFPAPPVTTEAAQVAYERVLDDAGTTLPRRDTVDQRVLREVREGTGHIIRWVREAGR